MTEFLPWPKIQRVSQLDVTITEKMDGTNACVVVRDGHLVACQSRKRFITPTDDNAGFAAWAHDHAAELLKLGDGHHFGEWCGPGIQKNPHALTEKRFFLFNTSRPHDELPACVSLVPVLHRGAYAPALVEAVMEGLRISAAEVGYKPEGVIVYFHAFRQSLKATFENRDGKWRAGWAS